MNAAKGIIFDFNGTLFFDYQENRDAWDETARLYRGYPFGEEEFLSMMGKLNRDCAAYICPSASIEELDRISEEKEAIYKRLCRERGLTLEKDAMAFIRKARERGVKVMIASSAPRGNMDWYEENLGLLEFFEKEDIVAGRNDIKGKPAPDVYLYTQKKGGLKGDECICFEDAPSGLMAGNAAGFRRVYAIDSPGMDSSVTSRLAPLVTWRWVLENIDEVLS